MPAKTYRTLWYQGEIPQSGSVYTGHTCELHVDGISADSMRLPVSRIIALCLGAFDGLSYSLALVLSGPVIVRFSGSSDYSKVAFVILLGSVGSLFNLVGTQGVIYILARSGVSAERRSNILSASLLVTLAGMALFAAILLLTARYTGARDIFPVAEIGPAVVMGWALCFLVSFDSVFAGALKARSLIALSASVELTKLLGIVAALVIVSRPGSWRGDCYCLIAGVATSAVIKGVLVRNAAKLRLSGWRAAFSEFREVTRVNSWQWLLILSNFLFQQADRLVIASRLGAEKFAIYNFCWQVSFVVHAASAASLISILPAATARVSRSSGQSLQEEYARDVKFGVLISTLLVVVVLTIALVAFNTRVVPGALKDGLPIFLIMLSCVYLSALSVVPYYYVVALGQLPAIACINVAGAGLSFVTALSTVGALGVTGLALSKAWGAVTLSCYWLCHRKMKRLGTMDMPL
jgi:O-antigen/teichoic acid export membrane protein